MIHCVLHEAQIVFLLSSGVWSSFLPLSSSETQGQSVGSGEKAGRKFSNTGERAPGYRLSPNYFQKFKRMPAPDWAKKKFFLLLCPIGEQFLLSSFREFVHDGYFVLPASFTKLCEITRNEGTTDESKKMFGILLAGAIQFVPRIFCF